jgi:hypothetical protein
MPLLMWNEYVHVSNIKQRCTLFLTWSDCLAVLKNPNLAALPANLTCPRFGR